MIPQPIGSSFTGGSYGGDIESQRVKMAGFAGSVTSSSFPTTAANAANLSSRVQIGIGLGLGNKFTRDLADPRDKLHHEGRVRYNEATGQEPNYTPINQLMVRDILTFLKNNALVNACVSIIPQRLLNKDFIWLGRLGKVNAAVKKALNNNWKIFCRDAFRSAVDIGLIMVKTRQHPILSEIPVVLSYVLHTPQFYITEDDEFKWRVVRNSDQAVIEDADVIEISRPFPTGHLASAMAMLLPEIYKSRFLEETFAYSIYHRARPPIVLQHERPRPVTQNESRAGQGPNTNSFGKTVTDGVFGQRPPPASFESESISRTVKAIHSQGNLPNSQEIGKQRLNEIINAPFRSHSIEMDDELKRTVIKLMNDFHWVQPSFPEVPAYLPQLLESFEKMCARVMHVPREVWADQYTKFKTSETLAHEVLSDTLFFWADVLENLCNPLIYKIYGMEEAFYALLFDEESQLQKPKFSKKKTERLRQEREIQIETFFQNYAHEEDESDTEENESINKRVSVAVHTPEASITIGPHLGTSSSSSSSNSSSKKRKRTNSDEDSDTESSNKNKSSGKSESGREKKLKTKANSRTETETETTLAKEKKANSKKAKAKANSKKEREKETSNSKTRKEKEKTKKEKSRQKLDDRGGILSQKELTLGLKLGWRHAIEQQELLKQRLSYSTVSDMKSKGNEQLINVITSLQTQINELKEVTGTSNTNMEEDEDMNGHGHHQYMQDGIHATVVTTPEGYRQAMAQNAPAAGFGSGGIGLGLGGSNLVSGNFAGPSMVTYPGPFAAANSGLKKSSSAVDIDYDQIEKLKAAVATLSAAAHDFADAKGSGVSSTLVNPPSSGSSGSSGSSVSSTSTSKPKSNASATRRSKIEKQIESGIKSYFTKLLKGGKGAGTP